MLKRKILAVLLSVTLSIGMLIAIAFTSPIPAAGATKSIHLKTPVTDILSAGNTRHDYQLHLDSPTDVGFIMFARTGHQHSVEKIEWYISIRSSNGTGFDVHSDALPIVGMHQGEATWDKPPERLAAGDYTVTVSAYEYVFAEMTPDGEMVENNLQIFYSIKLTGKD